MNKNRLGEEHPVKISKNNSLTSRAGFCLPSASQRSPGKPGGLGELQRCKETSAKSGGRRKKHLGAGSNPGMIPTKTPPESGVSSFPHFIPSDLLGWGKDGGKSRQKRKSWERNGVQVKPSPKPMPLGTVLGSIPGKEGFILGSLWY